MEFEQKVVIEALLNLGLPWAMVRSDTEKMCYLGQKHVGVVIPALLPFEQSGNL
ncbi:hypothetical protein SBA3_1420050 [Candidatus Sulfopaludibacter sp. SbA3]|nr:hypothetical protein SBA3_1420050 [Candidatus Sulfopaludibacter sp. SbA3]